MLVWGAQFADESSACRSIFLVLLYLLHTTGELFLSPVGLSAMTKLAPAAVVSTMMATWFLARPAAQALAAQIAKLTAQETVGGQVLDPQAALATYVDVFNQIGWAVDLDRRGARRLEPAAEPAGSPARRGRQGAAAGEARHGELRRGQAASELRVRRRRARRRARAALRSCRPGSVGRVLAVDDDRRDAFDAVAAVQLVGALQLGLHRERVERGLERRRVDVEAAEEFL